MKKNSQNISEQDFQQHNKAACQYYERPSPKYPPKPTKFEKLAYVVSTTFFDDFNQKPENNFNHSDASPFQSVTPRKK